MPKKNNIYINLDNLDEAIEKLTQIKKLLEDIQHLQENTVYYPSAPQPEPMPYIPQQPSHINPIPFDPWPPKIWC